MKKVLNIINEQHWYLIAAAIIAAGFFWLYGCQSTVTSMIDPSKMVTRAELQNEADFLLAQLRVKMQGLDQQDAIKQLFLDQAAIFGQTGQLNPAGLMNLIVSIGAISFGLNRNQKYKAAVKK